MTRRTDPKAAFGVLALGVVALLLSVWVLTSTGVAIGAPPGPSGGGGGGTNSGIPELQAALDSHEQADAARLAALEAANAQRAADLEAANAQRAANLEAANAQGAAVLLARIDTLEAANVARESGLQNRIDTLEAANALRTTNQEAANAVRTQAVRDDIDALRPRQLSYRDRLVDVNGIPIVLGKELTFAIYADEAKTTKLWEHTADIYPDLMGYYDIVLGEEAGNPLPASVFEGPARYLAVTVGGNLPALLPPAPGTSGEIPLQTLFPNVPTHRLESNFGTMLNQTFPDVELGLEICGAIDGSYRGAGEFGLGLEASGEAVANTGVLPLGFEAAVTGLFFASAFGELSGGVAIGGSACLQTSFPVLTPVLPDASGQALGAPAGFGPLDIVNPLTSASQQIGTIPTSWKTR